MINKTAVSVYGRERLKRMRWPVHGLELDFPKPINVSQAKTMWINGKRCKDDKIKNPGITAEFHSGVIPGF